MANIFYLDRYSNFVINNENKTVPFVKIPDEPTDKYVKFKKRFDRMDILSNRYYNNPYHGFLIMMANPEFGGLEFDIPNGATIRIPFPFESAIERYNKQVVSYINLYGK